MGSGPGLLALILLGVALALLDGAELSRVLSPVRPVLPAFAATTVWLAGAWVPRWPAKSDLEARRWRQNPGSAWCEPARVCSPKMSP